VLSDVGITVQVWTGREVRALREAKRMSIRAFSAHLGVSERMVSKWEKACEDIRPRPVNQHALDSSLAASGAEVQARFSVLLGDSSTLNPDDESSVTVQSLTDQFHQARHPVDGKLMTFIDAGVFLAGEHNEPVWLSAFYIDVFPTTNVDYQRFTQATGHPIPQHWTHNGAPDEASRNDPVTFVTWQDAMTYAAWAAKSLPTAHQWEKAARGSKGDVYPWGNQMTPAKANVREGGLGHLTPVSRYHSGVSPYGVYDMCGNAWEWCSTESEPGRHELKGSAFTSPFFRCTPSAFNDASEFMLDDDTGFRCVSPAETMRALLNLKT
jgi:formylglycine-generating enzyme required for sulfatase activity